MNEIKAILPTPTAESAPFWEGCNRGELLLRRCRSCGHLFYYPRLMCVRCTGRDLDWQASAGRGTVYSYSTVEISFYGSEWESQLPYTVLLVDLDEGPRMLSRLAGMRDDRLRAGAPVKLHFVTVGGQALPFFRLAGES